MPIPKWDLCLGDRSSSTKFVLKRDVPHHDRLLYRVDVLYPNSAGLLPKLLQYQISQVNDWVCRLHQYI